MISRTVNRQIPLFFLIVLVSQYHEKVAYRQDFTIEDNDAGVLSESTVGLIIRNSKLGIQFEARNTKRRTLMQIMAPGGGFVAKIMNDNGKKP
jgi:hypothetical protein